MLRNCCALSNVIFLGFWSVFEAILGPKMEPKSKKNAIKNKSDFKTKLEGRRSGSGPRTWTGQAPLGAPNMRARSFFKTKNQSTKG